MSDSNPGFSTLAIHAGAQPDPATGARVKRVKQFLTGPSTLPFNCLCRQEDT